MECQNTVTIRSLPRPKYQYASIEAEHEIRILVLAPAASYNAKLQATLITTRLDEKPQYEAISYVWGPPVFSKTIELIVDCLAAGGPPFPARGTSHLPSARSGERSVYKLAITRSLAGALMRFRLPDRPRASLGRCYMY